jgi:RimK family alpha-L-glutamate ligase
LTLTAQPGGSPLVAVVGWRQETNERLASAWSRLGIRAVVVSPFEAAAALRPDDVAVGRLDVLESLDGVQPGLEILDALQMRAIRMVNGRSALLNAHDKLRTAALLGAAGIPHPATAHVRSFDDALRFEPPFVVKPRFGSWGREVARCKTREEVAQLFARITSAPWFRDQGAIVQELVPSPGFDLRIVVADGHVVGATERVAPPGEWRTNVALGGTRRAVRSTNAAKALATAAATVVARGGLVGVDLLPVAGGHVVLELNGAVEFDRAYDLDGTDVFAAAASALGLDRPQTLGMQSRSRWGRRRPTRARATVGADVSVPCA